MPTSAPVHRPRSLGVVHRVEAPDRREHQRMYSTRWRRARADYLADNPLCVACRTEGRVRAAAAVDHIAPHRGDHVLFWRRSNWQALCASHHNAKTASEDGGFGNARRKP